MARPSKATVDYYPHSTTHGKTMFIIESQFGNDGYAFWFKLLEILGNSEGHYCDCNNPDNWEYLQAYTRLNEDICTQILNKLAKLEAINRPLWEQNRVIWSDNFVDGIKDAYKRRIDKLPSKPSLCVQKPPKNNINTDINPTEIAIMDIPDNINRESKEKEKVNIDSKEDVDSKSILEATTTNDKTACQFYQEVLGRLLNPVEIQQMIDWEDAFGRDLAIEVIKCGVKNGVLTLNYLQTILDNWKLNNIKTVAEVMAHEEKRKSGNKGSPGKPTLNHDDIWDSVKAKLNPYQTPEWVDPVIAAAVKHVGYSKLCEMDEQYAKRVFISAYKNALKEVG